MTVYGIDVSNQNGTAIDMADVKAQGFDFVFAKVSEGCYFTDKNWPAYRDAAQRAGLLIAGYHYAIASCEPAAQVRNFQQQVDDLSIPVMIDFESSPGSVSGTVADFWNLVRAFNAAGQKVALSYIPHWYWAGDMGGGDLSTVSGLIASAYPDGTGYAAAIYQKAGGDTGIGWTAYGGRTPDIWQFTDQATVGATTVDANAFRGTRDDLAALLRSGATPPPQPSPTRPPALSCYLHRLPVIGGVLDRVPLVRDLVNLGLRIARVLRLPGSGASGH